jgi:phosphonate transport system substrate-binding protein
VALLTGLVLGQAGAAEAPGPDRGDYRFGVAAYLPPVRMGQLYGPMASAFSKALDHPVRFRTATTFGRYFEQQKAGDYEIALVHAMFYVAAVDEQGYLPVARMVEPFKGLIVVLDQSPVRSLDDLRGQVIATPPAYLPTVHLARRVMRERGFEPSRDFKFESFRSVESCLHQVLIGAAAACVCPPFALRGVEQTFQVRFRTVVESPGIPNLTFVVHKRVPEAERRRLLETIVGWRDDPEGRRMVGAIGSSGFVEAHDADFDEVRQMMKHLDMPWRPSED